jgi:hypothetical protein
MGAVFIMTSKTYIPDLGVFNSYIVLTNKQVRKTIFSPEKIIKYLEEPEQLMINTKKAIKEALPAEEVSERWSEYFPSNERNKVFQNLVHGASKLWLNDVKNQNATKYMLST